MPTLIQAKQISKMMLAMVGIAGFVHAAPAATADISAAIATAYSTAANSGTAIPVQVGSASAEGVSVGSGLNSSLIYDSASGENVKDANGNEVYGKITNAGAVYTLSAYSVIAGVETAFSLPAGTYDFEVPTWFTFDNLPATALIGPSERHVQPDPSSATRIVTDTLTPTALNTLPALSQTPQGGLFMLNVNGQVFSAVSQFGSVAGTAVTWTPATAGFNLATTDVVTATYTY